jgi:hypothetical protein
VAQRGFANWFGEAAVLHLCIVFLKFQLISAHRLHRCRSTTRQFQYGMAPQTHRHAPALHIVSYFKHLSLLVEKQHVDRKFHSDRMDRLAGSDPKSFARPQLSMLQESGTAFLTGVRNIGALGQSGSLGSVVNTQFWQRIIKPGSQLLLHPPESYAFLKG